MQAINGCAFCRANRKPWSNHTADRCVELANCVCGYCKEKGHTPKKCPKSALKKQREEEWAKRKQEQKQREEENFPALIEPQGKSEVAPKSTWSSLVVKSLTAEERETMEHQHREKKQRETEEKRKQYEERQKKREEAAIRAEQYYVRKMRREYGIEECGIGEPGDFWYFFIEGRKDDSNMAKVLRENEDNQFRFKAYLREKYFVNWLSCSEYTEDDCRILDRWRWEQERWEYEQEEREQAEVDAYIKAEEELREAMREKLEKGEITQSEYDEWKWQKELEDEFGLEREGDMMWHAHQQHERNFDAWKKRSEERKAKYGK